jgi:hypothetical protein
MFDLFYVTYWAGLQKDVISMQLDHGAKVLNRTALHFHPQGRKDGEENKMAIVWAGKSFCAWLDALFGW